MAWNKILVLRHCEDDSPKQSIESQHSGLLPASYLAVRNDGFRFLLLLLLLFSLSACSISYSFQGGRLNYDVVKTITIREFPNRTPNYPLLSQVLDQALRKRYIEQTRLVSANNNGDIEIEGEITQYTIQSLAVQDNFSSRTRLTITMRVKYTNNKEANSNVDQTFSAFREFDASRSISEVEDQLVKEIVEELVDKIYNETVSNW